MRHEYPLPGNEDEFEETCLRFFRITENRPGLVRYGKRGEEQDGIDLIDPRGDEPRLAVQCKRHEPTKTIPPAEIKKEVKKAEGSEHPVDRYIIATTAKKSRRAQDTVIELNRRPQESRKFVVELVFWEDVNSVLDGLARDAADQIVFGTPAAGGTLAVGYGTHYQVILAGGSAPTDATGVYADINRLFEERRIEVAEHEIAKLPNPECNPGVTAQDRYEILRLRAKLALEQEEFDEAARLFFLACETLPTNTKARQNRVLALWLNHDRESAFREASVLVEEGADTPMLASFLVRAASSKEDLTPHQAFLEEHEKTDEALNIDLVNLHLRHEDIDAALASANQALLLSPESSHALWARGMVSHHLLTNGPWQERAERASEALEYYAKAAEAACRDKHPGLVPEILCNRARVNALLNDADSAASDYLTGVESAKRPSGYAIDAVDCLLHFRKYEVAKQVLSYVGAEEQHRSFQSVVVEFHTADPDERRRWIEKMKSIALGEGPDAEEACCHAVEWALNDKDTSLASSCISDSLVEKNPLLGCTLRSWVAIEEGDQANARTLAQRAAEALTENAHVQELDVLASLLRSLELDEEALPIWERVYTPGVLNDDCKSLISCAQRLERHDTLLRVCDELAETGQIDDLMRRIHVQILLRYDPGQAADRAADYQEFDFPYFRSVRNYVAASRGERGQIVLDDSTLPDPAEIHPEDAALVLTPLAFVGRNEDALHYAYRLMRSHFNSERAHGLYIWYFLTHTQKNVLRLPRSIEGECGVRLRKERTGEERWLILESDQPDASHDEFDPENPIIAGLQGKKVGDLVTNLGGPDVPAEAEKIIRIETKHVPRFQDSISQFSRRFPGSPAFQTVHIGSGEDIDVSPILDMTKRRADGVEKLLSYYRGNLYPLYALAKSIGINLRQLMLTLSIRDEDHLQCVDFSLADYGSVANAIAEASCLVLDMSSIVTISRLKAWDHIDEGKQLLVPHGLVSSVDNWLEELKQQSGTPRGTMELNADEQLCMSQPTEEEHEAEIREVESIKAAIVERCTASQTLATSRIDASRRELYSSTIGPGAIDAIALAEEKNAVLCTDDMVTGVVAQVEFGVTRAWSQALFRACHESGSLTAEEFGQVTAQLLGWNYVSTVWNASDLVAAGKLAAWDTQSLVMRRSMLAVKLAPIPLAQKAGIIVDFLRKLGTSDCPNLLRTATIQLLLNTLDQTKVVRWMEKRTVELFALEPIWGEYVRDQFIYWLRIR